jgi:hypothetical protein
LQDIFQTDWIFQEDNAPCHISVRANQWKEENNINTLPWPDMARCIILLKKPVGLKNVLQ